MVIICPERGRGSDFLGVLVCRVAEEVIFGKEKVTTGASNDFMQVSRVARQMVERLGFSKKIGQVAIGGGGGNPFLGQQVTRPNTSSSSRGLLFFIIIIIGVLIFMSVVLLLIPLLGFLLFWGVADVDAEGLFNGDGGRGGRGGEGARREGVREGKPHHQHPYRHPPQARAAPPREGNCRW